MRNIVLFLTMILFFIVILSCNTTHTLKVEPMHITIDVNVKVDKALDDFFGDIDALDEDAEGESTP